MAVINSEQYIQHNPETLEGRDGLARLFKQLSKTSPRVNIVRIFSDGDYIFGHTEYDFSSSRVGFEVFRFEGDQTVEHWDNIQPRQGPNLSGHSMVDGVSKVSDIEQTEANRELVSKFVELVLIACRLDELPGFVTQSYTEHNPRMEDGLDSLHKALSKKTDNAERAVKYEKLHRLLADGDFVLSVCEGFLAGVHSSFYDLYRIADGKIVEHWDTTEAVAPRHEWKNDNGKF